ncbi:MAG: ROK family protein [Rhodanobacter sp.]
MRKARYGAIEAGGTKFICEVADAEGVILAATRIATTTPADTLAAVLDFFALHETADCQYTAFGIASFGPVDINPDSPSWGQILNTPKAGWSGTNLVAPLARRFNCPVNIDTDVNAAALAEYRDGAGRGCKLVVYITVGTGIGGGICVEGSSLPTTLHPEMGHIRVLRHPADMSFAGVCPFHGDCLEGLASGPAIVARFGTSLDKLSPAQGGRDIVGYYLGQLATNVILMLAPQRIIFGGGVMSDVVLLDEIRATAGKLLNGYAGLGTSADALRDMIVAPGLAGRSGIAGALALARAA